MNIVCTNGQNGYFYSLAAVVGFIGRAMPMLLVFAAAILRGVTSSLLADTVKNLSGDSRYLATK